MIATFTNPLVSIYYNNFSKKRTRRRKKKKRKKKRKRKKNKKKNKRKTLHCALNWKIPKWYGFFYPLSIKNNIMINFLPLVWSHLPVVLGSLSPQYSSSPSPHVAPISCSRLLCSFPSWQLNKRNPPKEKNESNCLGLKIALIWVLQSKSSSCLEF